MCLPRGMRGELYTHTQTHYKQRNSLEFPQEKKNCTHTKHTPNKFHGWYGTEKEYLSILLEFDRFEVQSPFLLLHQVTLANSLLLSKLLSETNNSNFRVWMWSSSSFWQAGLAYPFLILHPTTRKGHAHPPCCWAHTLLCPRCPNWCWILHRSSSSRQSGASGGSPACGCDRVSWAPPSTTCLYSPGCLTFLGNHRLGAPKTLQVWPQLKLLPGCLDAIWFWVAVVWGSHPRAENSHFCSADSWLLVFSPQSSRTYMLAIRN